jgi:hypothetical protein
MGDGGLVNTAPEDSPPVNSAHHIIQSHGVANVQVIGRDESCAEARGDRGPGGRTRPRTRSPAPKRAASGDHSLITLAC